MTAAGLDRIPVPVDQGAACVPGVGIGPAGGWAVYWLREGGARREWIASLAFAPNRHGLTEALTACDHLRRRSLWP